MLLSCKITNSALTFAERCGDSLDQLFEAYQGPTEFLRDPSSWMMADQVEEFLQVVVQHLRRTHVELDTKDGIISHIGHQSRDLRAWGVLDSVLRMVQAPKDLFAQPDRLLSYFISPAPPIADLKRGPDSVSFSLPIPADQFPLTTSFLKAALEGLPIYINRPMAAVVWGESRVHIAWSENQTSLFSESQNRDLTLHPELVRNILLNLESSQKQLEELKKELLVRDEELRVLRAQIAEENRRALRASQPSAETGRDSISGILEKLYRMNDYWARGQQLITLLIGQGRNSPQIQEAMRKTNWAQVSQVAPEVMRESIAGMQKLENQLNN